VSVARTRSGIKAEGAAAQARERLLDAIIQTRRQLAALLADLGAVAAGEGATKPGRYAADVYPRAKPGLVGDSHALAEYLRVATDLAGLEPGSGLRASQGRAMAEAEQLIHIALEAQELRALAGEPLRELSAEELGTAGAALRGFLARIEGRPHEPPPGR
jgi:hypothetical protein